MKSIINQMVGRDLAELFPRVPHLPGEPILTLESLRAGKTALAANLVLRRGEIMGIAGLVGAGRTSLLRAVFGLAPVISGAIRIHHFKGGYAPPGRGLPGGWFSERGPQVRGAGTFAARLKTTSAIRRSGGTLVLVGCGSKSGVPRWLAGSSDYA